MDMINLVRPQALHKQEAETLKKEFFAHGEAVINGSALLDQMDYEPWLEYVRSAQRIGFRRQHFLLLEKKMNGSLG